jgi:hypothetical protein
MPPGAFDAQGLGSLPDMKLQRRLGVVDSDTLKKVESTVRMCSDFDIMREILRSRGTSMAAYVISEVSEVMETRLMEEYQSLAQAAIARLPLG